MVYYIHYTHHPGQDGELNTLYSEDEWEAVELFREVKEEYADCWIDIWDNGSRIKEKWIPKG